MGPLLQSAFENPKQWNLHEVWSIGSPTGWKPMQLGLACHSRASNHRPALMHITRIYTFLVHHLLDSRNKASKTQQGHWAEAISLVTNLRLTFLVLTFAKCKIFFFFFRKSQKSQSCVIILCLWHVEGNASPHSHQSLVLLTIGILKILSSVSHNCVCGGCWGRNWQLCVSNSLKAWPLV